MLRLAQPDGHPVAEHRIVQLDLHGLVATGHVEGDPAVDGVTGQAGLGFGGLLRRLHDEAGLTQDELAEAAQVSQRAISDLERGINATARKDTAVLLAKALGLDGPATSCS
jgi:DNA-binding XRE family transcriptional regulator